MKRRYSWALFLLVPFLVRPTGFAQTKQKTETTSATTAYSRLNGKWLRPDGGYVLELKEATPGGRLKARYFNPSPIHVAKADWHREKDNIQVFVELRDVNYPGSTYTLFYVPQSDTLEGAYYQAVEGRTYSISFVRVE